jgi:hypothetical protein
MTIRHWRTSPTDAMPKRTPLGPGAVLVGHQARLGHAGVTSSAPIPSTPPDRLATDEADVDAFDSIADRGPD